MRKNIKKNKIKNNPYYVGEINNTIYIFSKSKYKKQTKENKKKFKEILGYENACKYRDILNKEKRNKQNLKKKNKSKQVSEIIKNKNLKILIYMLVNYPTAKAGSLY